MRLGGAGEIILSWKHPECPLSKLPDVPYLLVTLTCHQSTCVIISAFVTT